MDQKLVNDEHAFVEWNEQMVRRYDIERYYERSHPLVRWIEQQRLAALVAFAAARPDSRVLEVGCGAGHVLQRFSGVRRTGIDLSTTMLERARRRLGPDVELIRASAELLPLDSDSFDVVLCTEVLEHTQHPDQVLRELVRVGTPSARIVVSIPNEANIDRAKRFIRRVPLLRHVLRSLAAEGNEWHLHQLDLAALRRIADGTARIEQLRGVPNGLMPVRYVALLRAHAA
ncbi:MAG TPA: class I SAM-dependent methyltransferase [Longimicrobiales bacterium]|nr:class I SAM-dependent methyltransferase [Longimicrobiales bacterium]